MARYYFRELESENCFNKKHFDEIMKLEGETSMSVYEAHKDVGGDFMFCKITQECGEKGNCGKICDDYEPRNKKNGACRHLGSVYEIGDKVTLKLDQ